MRHSSTTTRVIWSHTLWPGSCRIGATPLITLGHFDPGQESCASDRSCQLQPSNTSTSPNAQRSPLSDRTRSSARLRINLNNRPLLRLRSTPADLPTPQVSSHLNNRCACKCLASGAKRRSLHVPIFGRGMLEGLPAQAVPCNCCCLPRRHTYSLSACSARVSLLLSRRGEATALRLLRCSSVTAAAKRCCSCSEFDKLHIYIMCSHQALLPGTRLDEAERVQASTWAVPSCPFWPAPSQHRLSRYPEVRCYLILQSCIRYRRSGALR